MSERPASRPMAIVLCAAALAAALAGLPMPHRAVAQSTAPEPLSAFPQSLLSVRTQAGSVINFKIWLADTPQREEQGLMFIHHMDSHAGMLFLFPGERTVSMWMKNTYIPLDMLFMNSHGNIDYIVANATPLSLDIIGPPRPEYAVLELNAGAAMRFGIAVGDTVVHPSFKSIN